ncbi:hypothetical protein BGZ98_007947 [Dissophora globulifera]|nr:hypothetical protein BGZ98_007947 [Dissophora globulifera]
MVLTPDHPSWHAPANSTDRNHAATSSENIGALGGENTPTDPREPSTCSIATTGNTEPFAGGSPHGASSRSGPGNDSFLPAGSVPLGARFDPITPGDSSVGPGRRGQGTSFRSGEPDFDELLPPR